MDTKNYNYYWYIKAEAGLRISGWVRIKGNVEKAIKENTNPHIEAYMIKKEFDGKGYRGEVFTNNLIKVF